MVLVDGIMQPLLFLWILLVRKWIWSWLDRLWLIIQWPIWYVWNEYDRVKITHARFIYSATCCLVKFHIGKLYLLVHKNRSSQLFICLDVCLCDFL